MSSTWGVVPCTINGVSFNQAHDCYLEAVAPPPPASAAPTPGAVAYACTYSQFGSPIPKLIAKVYWIAPGNPGVTRADAQAAMWQVLASVTMPTPALNMGPAPSLNEWNMAVVGYPLWFWTTESNHETATQTANGIAVTITAKRLSTSFDFGDGTSLTCTKMTAYPTTFEPMIVSPDCGHVYEKRSLPDGTYPIKATAHWQIDWTAAGYSGTETRNFSQTMQLRVGELQSVRVG